MGKANAAVFPVPVWAHPSTSRPETATGIAFAWIGVGVLYCSSFSARCNGAIRSISSKVFNCISSVGVFYNSGRVRPFQVFYFDKVIKHRAPIEASIPSLRRCCTHNVVLIEVLHEIAQTPNESSQTFSEHIGRTPKKVQRDAIPVKCQFTGNSGQARNSQNSVRF